MLGATLVAVLSATLDANLALAEDGTRASPPAVDAPAAPAPATTMPEASPPTTQTTAPASSVSATPAARIARECRARHELPGLVCALVGTDGLRQIGADGVRARGADAAITIDDRMHLGSCTKAFTATLAAVLVADGAIGWDTTIGQVLAAKERTVGADAVAPTDLHARWRDVTLEQLLRHRSGAAKEPPAEAWRAAFLCEGPARACRAAFLKSVLSAAPAGPAGTFVYSNQGYAIAGMLLETVADEAYESLLERRVLAPLGIKDFGFGPPSRAHPDSPRGHDDESGALSDIDNPNAIAPAGTLHMPLGEWAKFIAFHLAARDLNEGAGAAVSDAVRSKAVKSTAAVPDSLSAAAKLLPKLHEPSPDAPQEAIGWRTATRAWGGAVLNHAGSNSKWYCVAWVAPERGFAVLAATNQGGEKAAAACDEACAALIEQARR